MANPIGQILGRAANIQAAASALLAGPAEKPWTERLRKASFRGVPFAVIDSAAQFGRRQQVHEYPFRDKPWVEDLGRGARRITINGFIVQDSRIYGGGDVLAQRDQLVAAAETAGKGTLSHPTLGDLQVTCDLISIEEKADAGRLFTFRLSFIEAGERLFPAAAASTSDAVKAAGAASKAAAALDFAKKAVGYIAKGAAALRQAVTTVQAWTTRITTFARDATALLRQVSALPGDFGRFFHVGVSGPFGLGLLLGSTGFTLAGLIGAGATARSRSDDAGAAVLAAIAGLNVSTTPADLAAAVQAQVDALAAASANPDDALRLLDALAQYTPPAAAGSDIGQALGDLYRRAAVIALAGVSAVWQPPSADAAVALMFDLAGRLDAEILIAGDQGEDATFDALRSLRAAVVQDLRARGADLAPVRTWTLPQPLPDLVAAQRLYRDAGRAAELVSMAEPVHPLFMPPTFQALAA